MNTNIEIVKLPNDNISKEDLIKRAMQMEQRAIKAEAKLEKFELLALYASDIVSTWPTITMRTLWKITEKVDTIKQILNGLNG